ncbi:hypothetical protein [Empedobacter brevis]|uniref:hypothetical protein n=1 Tax=Empedobacter brevis TaxID=247 RepID=UPI0028A72641|nr:hypothetical protein [Empedobacter brevis]
MIGMIDYVKLQTFSQPIIIHCKNLELLSDTQKKGRECWKINDRIKFEFRPVYEDNQIIGYTHLCIIIQPHFIFNNGIHNGNEFSDLQCIQVLNSIFTSIHIDPKQLTEFKITSLEFGVNVIPKTDIKEVINSICYWKRKPFKRNKAKYSLISITSLEKQIKTYAKGIDAVERLKTDEVHPNTYRFEIKEKKSRKIKLTADLLLKSDTYKRFQQSIIEDFEFVLFLEQDLYKKSSNSKESRLLKEYQDLKTWEEFLNNKNRDKFNYNRKKYESISFEYSTIKKEIKNLILQSFQNWKNSAKSPLENIRQNIRCQTIN